MRREKRARCGGSTIVEFAFSMLLLIPLTVGVYVLGFSLTRGIQVVQVGRDAGHMFARGVDFAVTANQDILVRLAGGLGMTRDGGEGTVIFSKVYFIGHDQCAAAGLSDDQCTNINWPVFTQRIVVGNRTLAVSAPGTPASVQSDGTVNNYLRDTTARANGFIALMPSMGPGMDAYMVEVYFRSTGLSLDGGGTTGVYSRSIF